MTTEKLFNREGVEYTGQVHKDEKGRQCGSVLIVCDRCGGQGGAVQWAHTGYTCYKCGGACNFGHRRIRLYTAAELDVLNERRDRRRVKAQAKRDAEYQARMEQVAVERATRFAEFSTAYPDVIERLEKERANPSNFNFMRSMVERLDVHGYLTENMVEAVRKVVAQEAFREYEAKHARHLWKVGDRVEAEIVWQRVVVLPDYGFGPSFLHIGKCDGADVVYKGSKGLVPWVYETHEVEGHFEVPCETKLRFTVKDHNEYNGTPQTRIARPTELH